DLSVAALRDPEADLAHHVLVLAPVAQLRFLQPIDPAARREPGRRAVEEHAGEIVRQRQALRTVLLGRDRAVVDHRALARRRRRDLERASALLLAIFRDRIDAEPQLAAG